MDEPSMVVSNSNTEDRSRSIGGLIAFEEVTEAQACVPTKKICTLSFIEKFI